MSDIYEGQDIAMTLTAVNPGTDDAANPAGVRFKVKEPDATITTYTLGADPEVVQTTAGKVYTLTLDASSSGAWRVRAEALNGAGTVIGVAETKVIVRPSAV